MLPYALILPLVFCQQPPVTVTGVLCSLAVEAAIDIDSAVCVNFVFHRKVSIKLDASAGLDGTGNLERSLKIKAFFTLDTP